MADDGSTAAGGMQPLERGRSLVFVDRRRGRRSAVSAAADFVAQLIASEERVGQYRQARRREPARAVAAYRTAPAGPSARFATDV